MNTEMSMAPRFTNFFGGWVVGFCFGLSQSFLKFLLSLCLFRFAGNLLALYLVLDRRRLKSRRRHGKEKRYVAVS
jgi:hypothetical protein